MVAGVLRRDVVGGVACLRRGAGRAGVKQRGLSISPPGKPRALSSPGTASSMGAAVSTNVFQLRTGPWEAR